MRLKIKHLAVHCWETQTLTGGGIGERNVGVIGRTTCFLHNIRSVMNAIASCVRSVFVASFAAVTNYKLTFLTWLRGK